MNRLLTLPLLLLLLTPISVTAQSWIKELTKAPPGANLNVPSCEIAYELGWNNWITAGKAALTVREAGAYWRADATAASTGFARKLWQYDCRMTSVIAREGIRSLYLSHRETDSAETCRYRVAFEPRRVVTATTVTPTGGTARKSQAICPYGPVDDLLSVILYVRSLELTPGRRITRVVQPWDKPYLTTFEVMGRETLRVGGQERPCIKVRVKIRKIDRETLELSSYKKMKTSTIWISDDALRLPIEMHAEVFVGFMSARMTSLRFLSGNAGKTTLPTDMKSKP